ncbi:tail fiber domain-containing protein [Enterobacter sp. SA24]
MIYNAGTISFNGNSVTGTGTNFTAPTSQIRIGQTLLVASNPVQLVQITAINSATSLTVTPAASPAVSGQRYGILVTDSLSVDGLAQSISQLINEYDENIGAWEAFATTNANQNVTVTINGQSVIIPAMGKLLQKGSNGALAVKDGGTGSSDAAGARTNLGLAASGMNTDITSATGLTTTIMRDQWVPDKALIVTLDAGSNVSYNNKAVTAKTMHNGLTMYTSFCYSIGADGTATNSGPALISTDGNNYTKYWKFQNGSGAITSHAGTFTPGVSDIRVKNEKRVITEQEAIAFISEWESIVYSLKWTPDAMRVGFRAQDIYERFPELINGRR